jgi:hypothetical protein
MAETVKELVQDHFYGQISKIKIDIDSMLKNFES